jgi:hypothetical protein
MIRKLMMLILKIALSPIWFLAVFSYIVIANHTKTNEEIDIWEYWRL